MTLEYTNRKGDRYYVFQGWTKTGKPKYYCSRKRSRSNVEKLPNDFEIYEHPQNGIVSIRRARPSRLTPIECEFVKEQIRSQAGLEHFIVDQSNYSFVVYVCDRSPEDVNEMIEVMCGPWVANVESKRQFLFQQATYSPAFRLTLTDDSERLFCIERWCDRGSIDDWISLSSRDRPLDELAATYFPHLGHDTYFDLI